MITDLPSPETIARFTVSIAAPVRWRSESTIKARLARQAAGLTARGTIPKRGADYPKHKDLAGLPIKERRRIITQRWRAAQKLKEAA